MQTVIMCADNNTNLFYHKVYKCLSTMAVSGVCDVWFRHSKDSDVWNQASQFDAGSVGHSPSAATLFLSDYRTNLGANIDGWEDKAHVETTRLDQWTDSIAVEIMIECGAFTMFWVICYHCD
jgi:hypothetical protein